MNSLYIFLGPPIIIKFEGQPKVTLGQTVEVKCIATGNPPPKVQMKFNDRLAQDVNGVKVTSSESERTIQFKAEINSTVHCEATNEVGRDKRKMKIAVDRK